MTAEPLYWREPLWLLAMLLPILAALVMRLRRRQLWTRIADSHLRPWIEAPAKVGRLSFARAGLVFAWLLLCVALAGPRTPQWIPPSVQHGDAAVMAVIDLSASMAARDGRPDRLRHAQSLLQGWMAGLPESLRVGLIVYAGHAHRLIRSTADHHLARHHVNELDGLRPPTLGNALGDALRLASEALAETQGSRHVLLISDGDLGEAAQQSALDAAVEDLALVDAKLRVIGVGGPEAVGVPQSATELLVIDGERIASRRDARWLRQLADSVDGRYLDAEEVADQSLAEVLNLPRSGIDPADSDRVLWDEWFGLPLLAAVLSLLLALQAGASVEGRGQSVWTVLLALLVGGCELGGLGDPLGGQARAALDAGDYAEAQRRYARLDGYEARFAEGVACYRLGDYPCALQSFAQAAWIAPDDSARGRAAFNLGNTHFRLGDFQQASVLFAEAETLGVATGFTRLNREFADSLAASVRRRLADIAETQRRAEWRAAARDMPEELRDRVAEGITLSRPSSASMAFTTLSAKDLQAMVARGVERTRAAGNNAQTGSVRHWVQSSKSHAPETTAGLFNRLMPMEVGLPTVPGEPYRVEGQRPW